MYVLLPPLLLQAILTPGLICGACHDCLPTTAWAKTGLSGGDILTATKLSSDNFPITDVGRPYPTRTDVPFQLNGLTIAALGEVCPPLCIITSMPYSFCLHAYACCPYSTMAKQLPSVRAQELQASSLWASWSAQPASLS